MTSKITRFEDLIIWQRAQELAERIYKLADGNPFIRKDFSLRNQLKSASISISDNIAEGFEYNNNPDFFRFLRISKGSCGEIRNKLLFIKRMNYVNDEEVLQLYNDAKLLGSQIGELMKKVKQKMLKEKQDSKTKRITHNS